MPPMQVLPIYNPIDSVVVHWGSSANANEDVRNFLGALVSVVCDFADVIVLTTPSEVENISQGLASLEIPDDYVQYIALPEIPEKLKWVFMQDTELNIHLVQTQETPLQTSLIDLLKSQDDFFSANLSSQPLNGLCHESLQVLSNGIGFIAATDLQVTNKSADELSSILGLRALISVDIPAPFVRLSQLLRTTPQGVLIANSSDPALQELLNEFRQALHLAVEAEQTDIVIEDFPLPHLSGLDVLKQASYGDFILVNEAVLVPQFDCPQDEIALESILSAFPGKEVYGIPAVASNDQFIELHSRVFCLPEGTLFPAS